MIKKSTKLTTILLILLVTVAVFEAETGTDTYRVRSVYRNSPSDQWANETVWRFEKQGPNQLIVRVNDNEDPAFVLIYAENQRLKEVVQKVRDKEGPADKTVAQASGEKVLLSQGFPLPFDDLDARNLNDGQAVLKKKAGGVTFAYTIQRKSEPVRVDAAISAGMVPPGFSETAGEDTLMMISAKKSGRLIVKQLWASGESWWRYEETPFRRSWLIVNP